MNPVCGDRITHTKKHGLLFKADKEWIEPTIHWARGEYNVVQ